MLSKTFFSNTTNRQIQLFELLSQSSKLSSKQDLLDQLQITERTLKKDIESLNHLISFVQLSEVEDSIQLKFKNDGSILDVYRFFIGKSLSLSLIKKIFLRENYKTSELAQELLTSETTIYRLIRNLNTIFKEKKLDITILTNPFMITGNERQIRYFISTLYLSQLKINNDNSSRWVFVDAMITLIHSNQLNQALSFYNYYDTEVFVYVNTVRFYYGHLIPEIELTNRGLVFLSIPPRI